MPSVALQYGYKPNRGNYICCPFHNEKTPSLKLYDNSFYCFGCGVGGDAVHFVSKLYNLPAIEAAYKLNTDFLLGLAVGKKKRQNKRTKQYRRPIKKAVSESEMHEYFNNWKKYAFRVLNDYRKLLKLWNKEFAPMNQDEEPYPLWVQACKEIPVIEEYLLILAEGDAEDKQIFFTHCRKEIDRIYDEYRKYIRE